MGKARYSSHWSPHNPQRKGLQPVRVRIFASGTKQKSERKNCGQSTQFYNAKARGWQVQNKIAKSK